LDSGSFDLVSAQYPALRHTSERDTEGLLLDLVAPGGTLLCVHHVLDADHGHGGHAHPEPGEDPEDAHQHDHDDTHQWDPADYVMPADIRARLTADWLIEVDEERDRQISGGGGAHHTRDQVLRIRRTSHVVDEASG
ncbi:MAG: hypothetical protein WBG57_06275, partial [Ornithinimicrobium sp.]